MQRSGLLALGGAVLPPLLRRLSPRVVVTAVALVGGHSGRLSGFFPPIDAGFPHVVVSGAHPVLAVVRSLVALLA